jgi:protein-tyrosine phosphatase
MTKLLIVCMGNICRSPMAQAVLTKYIADAGRVQQMSVESAGTHASRSGEKADNRAEASLARRGYDLGRFRSRRVSVLDFDKFDWILAMDQDNLTNLQKICPPELQNKLHLYLSRSSQLPDSDVPDPYYGNAQGFDSVLDLCETGAKDWMRKLA